MAFVNAHDQNLGLHTSPSHDLQLVASEVPKPRPHEVLIRMSDVGICGSDVHFWKHGSVGGEWAVESSHGLGHEGAGVIVGLGAEVEKSGKLSVGDRVSIEPGIPCFLPSCDQCRHGRYNNCPTGNFYGAPPLNGLLRRYHSHPASWVYKLPDEVSNEVGALMEPLSVALHAVRRGKVSPGDLVLVTGAGAIGILTAVCARAAGAAPIYITDIDEQCLALAREAVPNIHTILIDPSKNANEVAEILRNEYKCHPKVALECSGAKSSLLTAIYSVQPSATVVGVGVGPAFVELPVTYLLRYEIDLRWVNRYLNTWPAALRMLKDGVIDSRNVTKVIQRRVNLENAIATLEGKGHGKILIKI